MHAAVVATRKATARLALCSLLAAERDEESSSAAALAAVGVVVEAELPDGRHQVVSVRGRRQVDLPVVGRGLLRVRVCSPIVHIHGHGRSGLIGRS
eukprot:14903172-Alexandrium_andersonii.AAC.1